MSNEIDPILLVAVNAEPFLRSIEIVCGLKVTAGKTSSRRRQVESETSLYDLL